MGKSEYSSNNFQITNGGSPRSSSFTGNASNQLEEQVVVVIDESVLGLTNNVDSLPMELQNTVRSTDLVKSASSDYTILHTVAQKYKYVVYCAGDKGDNIKSSIKRVGTEFPNCKICAITFSRNEWDMDVKARLLRYLMQTFDLTDLFQMSYVRLGKDYIYWWEDGNQKRKILWQPY